MREVNLRSVDLNLLTVLQVLLEERHVTRAAERLHMSQSAVSRALQRLRQMFDDELLVKQGERYKLSLRAEKLSAELAGMLQGIARLIQEPEFDPVSVQAVIRFAGLDLESWVDMPEFMSQLMEQAPNISVEVLSKQADYYEMLEKGLVDYVVSGIPLNKHPEKYRSCELGESTLGIIMGADNPLAVEQLTLEKYLNAAHGFVSMTGKGPTHTDKYLESVGMKRNLVLKISELRSVIDYVEKTNILFRLPVELIKPLIRDRKIIVKSLPIELEMPKVNFRLYWHVRSDQDPLHAWIKQKVLDVRRVSA